MNAITLILWVSVAAQVAASILALRLIPLSRHALAWILLSAAFLFMALRRITSLLYQEGLIESRMLLDVLTEGMALAISLFLVIGIYRIRSLFIELRRASEVLRESEQAYRTLAENLPGIVYRLFLRDGGRMQLFSREAEAITGYTPEELTKGGGVCPIAPLIVAEDRPAVIAEVQRAIDDCRPFSIEYRLRAKNGSTRIMQEQGVPQCGSDGLPFCIDGVIFDVTASRQAAERMRESEELHRAIFNQARDGIVLIDADTGLVSDCNPEFERQCARTLSQLKEFHIWELRPPGMQDAARRKFEEVRETGNGSSSELHLQRPDGTVVPVEFVATRIRIGERVYLQSICRDITERKRTEQELQTAHDLLEHMFESIHVLVAYMDCDFNFIRVNHAYAQADNHDPDFFPGKNHFALYPGKEVEAIFRQVVKTGEPYVAIERPFEYAEHPERGISYWDWRIALVQDANGHAEGLVFSLLDVTERVRARQAVEESEHLRRMLLDTLTQKVFYKDRNSVFIACNAAFARDLRIEPEGIAGKTDYDFFPAALAEKYRADDREVMDSARLKDIEELYFRNGKEFWIHTVKTPMRDASGNVTGVLGIFWDVTEQRHATTALKRSEASLAEAQRIAHLGSWELDLVANKLAWSDEIYRIFEIDPRQFGASYEAFLATIHPDDRKAVDLAYTEHVKKHVPYDIVHRLLFKDGRVKYVHERCETTYDNSRPLRSLGTVQDITARRLGEIALSKVMRSLRMLSGSNEALIHIADEAGLLQEVCRIAVEVGGYQMAMVAFAEQDDAKTLRPVAHAGTEAEYAGSAKLSWPTDSVQGQDPGSIALRAGQPYIARGIPTGTALDPLQEEALRRGFRSVIALPLSGEGQTFGMLSIYASEPDAFDAEEVEILKELAGDLAYGIFSLRTRQERLKGEERLRENLVETIRAIALTVEKRDPYTAGHQQRVSELCVAIGQELKLDAGHIEGLRLGAAIHDIGKIYIPAEILNRPGKLSVPEFEIIKTHPQVGYDIVKDIRFPWPVAQIILQHHEYLDGTGYPRHLKGEDILMEACILTVADIVEAMMSHRPYRPALGLEAALAYIEQGKGTRYAPAVVDACVRLFREQRFSFG